MDKIIRLNIGDYCFPSFSKTFNHLYDTIDVYDDVISIEVLNNEEKDTSSIISFRDEKSLGTGVSNLFPANNVIIGSWIQIHGGDDVHERIKVLLEKIFLSIKVIYAPLVYQRKGAVWIIAPRIDTAESDTEPLISAAKEGVKALSIVAAMELSRKRIIINYIDADPVLNSKAIEKIVQWGIVRKNNYLTGQEVRL